MARSRVATGMTIKDITRMRMDDFNKFTTEQKREIVSRLGSAANKRLRTLEKHEITNPATMSLEASGGKISVRGKSGKTLQDEFYRAKQFLTSTFSTKKGWNTYVKQMLKEEQTGYSLKFGDSKLSRLAFAYYDHIQDINPKLVNKSVKYTSVDNIMVDIRAGFSGDALIKKAVKDLSDAYEEEQKQYKETGTTLRQQIIDDVYKKE